MLNFTKVPTVLHNLNKRKFLLKKFRKDLRTFKKKNLQVKRLVIMKNQQVKNLNRWLLKNLNNRNQKISYLFKIWML